MVGRRRYDDQGPSAVAALIFTTLLSYSVLACATVLAYMVMA